VGALPYLQRAALTPHLRDLAHDSEVGLNELRTAAAEATEVKVPDIVQLRRVRLRDVVVVVLAFVSVYLLIAELADIGFGTIAHELRGAVWQWIVIAVLLALLPLGANAVSLGGALAAPLPFGPTVALESAIKFVSLALPSSAGSYALHIRYLQRLGIPLGTVVAGSAVNDLTGTLVQVVFFLLSLPFVRLHSTLGVHFDSLAGPLLVVLAVVAVAVAVVAFVPAARKRVLPTVLNAWHHLGVLSKSPHDLALLIAGNATAELLFALTLGAVCLAYGQHLSLAELLLVNIGATVLAGLVPVLCTHYLPPIWGYASLQWLTRKGYV